MKRLFLIGGTMGVGKTTTSRILRDRLPSCAFLDGDWCWDMHPFKVTEETKRMVTDNICHVLNNFLACTEFENVVLLGYARAGHHRRSGKPSEGRI